MKAIARMIGSRLNRQESWFNQTKRARGYQIIYREGPLK
jgi:hypothetical protein